MLDSKLLSLVSCADRTKVRRTFFFQVSVDGLMSIGLLLAFGKQPYLRDNGTCSVPSIRELWFGSKAAWAPSGQIQLAHPLGPGPKTLLRRVSGPVLGQVTGRLMKSCGTAATSWRGKFTSPRLATEGRLAASLPSLPSIAKRPYVSKRSFEKVRSLLGT